MSITEERRARHLELRERMLAGDNGARWELAMECAEVIVASAYKGRRAPKEGDSFNDAVLIGYRIVTRWDPSKGALNTIAWFSAGELRRKDATRHSVVRPSDQNRKARCRSVYESEFDEGSKSGRLPEFDSVLGSTGQDHAMVEIETAVRKSRVSPVEAHVALALAHGWTLKECAAHHGLSHEGARMAGNRGLAKLAEFGRLCG